MKAMIAAVAALLAVTPAAAQTAAVPVSRATLLNLSVESQVRRAPDLALFSAGVVTQARTAGEAMTANARRMEAVVAALKAAGIADRDVQTAALNLQPQYFHPQPERPRPNELRPPQPRAPQIIGYEARNSVQVRVRRLADMGRVIDALVAAGANQVDGPMFMIENQDAALDEARADAIRKARARADLYARSAGLRVARIAAINEAGAYFPQPAMRDAIVVTGSAVGAPPPPPSPVSPGELQLGVNLSVQFELMP
jgi:uncharacterized protein YggE